MWQLRNLANLYIENPGLRNTIVQWVWDSDGKDGLEVMSSMVGCSYQELYLVGDIESYERGTNVRLNPNTKLLK